MSKKSTINESKSIDSSVINTIKRNKNSNKSRKVNTSKK